MRSWENEQARKMKKWSKWWGFFKRKIKFVKIYLEFNWMKNNFFLNFFSLEKLWGKRISLSKNLSWTFIFHNFLKQTNFWNFFSFFLLNFYSKKNDWKFCSQNFFFVKISIFFLEKSDNSFLFEFRLFAQYSFWTFEFVKSTQLYLSPSPIFVADFYSQLKLRRSYLHSVIFVWSLFWLKVMLSSTYKKKRKVFFLEKMTKR